MLHLAQVQNNESVGGAELKLLARQHSDNTWAVINPESIPLTDTNFQNEGLLVLVDLSDQHEVLNIQYAKDWMLDVIQKYLTTEMTPSFLQEEAKRIEEWRQDLTLQSQDLTRRHLEMEARREQIQTLEEDLKKEKQQLELTAAQLKAKEEQLEQEKQQLDMKLEQLNSQ